MKTNSLGQPVYHVAMADDEMMELILLIEDKEVDEEKLEGICKKLKNKRRMLKRRVREESELQTQ